MVVGKRVFKNVFEHEVEDKGAENEGEGGREAMGVIY